ncbi:MAG: hydrogenase expression/formation C-terminal domain-containing protein [Chromatiales bacterium]|jgi:hydrogenase-1 operon protein HyaF
MSRLEDIGISVESPGLPESLTGNAQPILHEILHALQRLSDSDEATVIDLHSIPFAPGDEKRLLEVLGHGEVDVHMHTLGETRIWESLYAGVWIVDHHNAEGERIAFHIEVSRVPEILRAQDEDISDGVQRFRRRLTPTGQ